MCRTRWTLAPPWWPSTHPIATTTRTSKFCSPLHALYMGRLHRPGGASHSRWILASPWWKNHTSLNQPRPLAASCGDAWWSFVYSRGVPQYHLDKKKVETKKKGHSL